MSYQALYRVWRPQKFTDLVGQNMITQTLKNAIMTQQTSHAYIFNGPRGTGKTSAAKIFAKAVNCHFQENGEPCNKCETCIAITNGQLNDVIEIDAASNNGVEEIRDIRDKVKYAPTQADFKIYIIDEVHMLSTGAFNALLKTLEEPPENVIFILATTEPHKIPATIISRTQKFDFKRITPADSYERMVYILTEKGIEYEEPALKVIAKAAEGGMRDALSILDQVISFGDNKVTLDNALLVTGSVTQDKIQNYVTEVSQKATTEALETIQAIIDEGKDSTRLIEDLIAYSRDLLLYQQAPALINQLELGMVNDDFKKLSQTISADFLYQMINVLNEIQQQMRFTTHPDVYLEVLTIRLSQFNTSDTTTETIQSELSSDASEQINNLTKTVEDLKKQIIDFSSQNDNQPQVAVIAKPKKVASTQKKATLNLSQIYPILDHATKESLVQLKQVWPELLQQLSVTQRAIMQASEPVAASPDSVLVSFNYEFLSVKASSDTELLDALGNGLDRLLHHVPKVVCITAEQWPEVRKSYIKQNEHEGTETIIEPEPEVVEPIVSKAEEIFGTENIEIKQD
ncbi:DNA polymerase III subunit gamma/tau [Dellaglioa sp. P0083]|uniref:DNA polymerase III subunit gamma/tau n=1 Tax=Dellaglioa kimchii TaxID=3344667 RepID=UPI0038D3C260